jgi:hypothetical protein
MIVEGCTAHNTVKKENVKSIEASRGVTRQWDAVM